MRQQCLGPNPSDQIAMLVELNQNASLWNNQRDVRRQANFTMRRTRFILCDTNNVQSSFERRDNGVTGDWIISLIEHARFNVHPSGHVWSLMFFNFILFFQSGCLFMLLYKSILSTTHSPCSLGSTSSPNHFIEGSGKPTADVWTTSRCIRLNRRTSRTAGNEHLLPVLSWVCRRTIRWKAYLENNGT